MRIIVGLLSLVGLLIALGIYLHLSATSAEKDLHAGKIATREVRQWAGQDENGVRAKDSITLDPVMNGPQIQALKVVTLMPGGPMAVHFGLQTGDLIVTVNEMKVGDNNDTDLAEGLLLDAYSHNWPIGVRRNGQELALPRQTAAAPAPNRPQAPQPSAAPAHGNVQD